MKITNRGELDAALNDLRWAESNTKDGHAIHCEILNAIYPPPESETVIDLRLTLKRITSLPSDMFHGSKYQDIVIKALHDAIAKEKSK